MKKVGLLVLVMLSFAQVAGTTADYSKMSANELNRALIIAVEEGSSDEVQSLVRLGANVNGEIIVRGSHGSGDGCTDWADLYTLLQYAASKGYLSIVKELIKAGVKVDTNNWVIYTSKLNSTALIQAAKNGHANVVIELIKAGANVNQSTDLGYTALIEAATQGHVDVVKELIKAGANVNQSTSMGDTPLIKAAENNHADVVRELVKAGANVNQENRWNSIDYSGTALIQAARKGHAPVVRELVKAVDAKSSMLSHVKCLFVNSEKCELCINKNDRNKALIQAARKGHANVVIDLVKAGANVNHSDEHGNTALMLAIRENNLNLVQILLKTPGININYADNDGNTALITALQSIVYTYIEGNKKGYNLCLDSQKIVELLLQTPGINPHHVNKNGDTAIKLFEKVKSRMG